jgi:hypothetical protein
MDDCVLAIVMPLSANRQGTSIEPWRKGARLSIINRFWLVPKLLVSRRGDFDTPQIRAYIQMVTGSSCSSMPLSASTGIVADDNGAQSLPYHFSTSTLASYHYTNVHLVVYSVSVSIS